MVTFWMDPFTSDSHKVGDYFEQEKKKKWQLNRKLGKFSKNRPLADSFIELQCQFVYIYIYMSPFHVIFFEAYFAPTSRSRISKNFRNPWGKVMERSGLRIEHFCWEVV